MNKHKKKHKEVSDICQSCPSKFKGFTSNRNKSDGCIKSLNFVTHYKKYEVRSCKECGQKWLLSFHPFDKERVDLFPFNENQKPKYEEWAKNLVVPTEEQMKILSQIIGINGDIYGNCKDYIDVPCKVTLNDGQVRDFSLIRFANGMPDEEIDNKNAFWLNQVAKIEPSENALPYLVRLETSLAEEHTNSYAPTLIENPEGKVFELNWTKYFFTTKKYKGSQFKLYKNPHAYFSEVPKELIAYAEVDTLNDGNDISEEKKGVRVYADWLKGYEKKLLKL